MNEEIGIIINFIKENNLIQLILPLAIPFILMHFSMRFIHLFTRSIKVNDVCKEKQNVDVVTNSTIPVELKNEMVLSNENFIRF